jgi:parallel beta-helix repeat protein
MNNRVMIVSITVICSVLILGAAIYVALRLQNTAPRPKRTIVVPDDYSTISDAIGNATEGATIYVKKGTYQILQNDALVVNKMLSIIGEDAENTLLSGAGFAYGTFIIQPKIAIMVYADNFKISNLTINNCDIGIYVIGNGTEISKTIMAGMSVSGSFSKVFDNNITDALAGNNSYLSTFTVAGSYHCISHNNIANIVGSECSVSLSNITENTMQGDIDLKGSSNIITGNSFRTMSLTSADSNVISNNSFSCLTLYSCFNNTVFGNTARGLSIYGILMSSGSGNVFYGNYIADYNGISTFTGRHYGYAVDIGSMAENNLFYHNNFVNNYVNLMYNWNTEMSNINYWDNEEEGNYWSDYNGVDANGDGIGDTSYLIYYRNVDRYPLMTPFDIDSVTVELPEWANISPSPQPLPFQEPSQTPETQQTEPFPTTLSIVSLASMAVAIIGSSVLLQETPRKIWG